MKFLKVFVILFVSLNGTISYTQQDLKLKDLSDLLNLNLSYVEKKVTVLGFAFDEVDENEGTVYARKKSNPKESNFTNVKDWDGTEQITVSKGSSSINVVCGVENAFGLLSELFALGYKPIEGILSIDFETPKYKISFLTLDNTFYFISISQ